ncbi:GNAT family N-acetyltransferase [Clostridium baratii]|uniref:GNAT family N-acetyltransferase n=1 Tax=Clostridium baratii TaxID=1561 RepID=UPI0009A262D5|nr:GNAT family N-acetyltransferase [Clostridium baratii]OPF51201.1 GNAT family acetyltransferase [Clostridium baratii]OPF55722.1 GNAT family N-acetyltransferase [Clostridium baratii]OPF56898.1 GNAT family N-acetyltransferase [Clostridium baratii]OPF59897.1 GNAT family N-acetyltransferase [Clostridium baratii]
MSKIIYREIAKKDYNTIKELIGEAFGFNEFINDGVFLDSVLTSYLQDCILESSFSKVAEKDNKVIGIILGKANKDNTQLIKEHAFFNSYSPELKSIMEVKENEIVINELLQIKDTYNEIIEGRKDDFQGCIQLFIVSKESRGLGIGKTLISYLFNYMRSMDVKSLYLYTDTRCNYKFYDSQNFKLLNENEIYFNSLKEKLNVFLYGYEFY